MLPNCKDYDETSNIWLFIFCCVGGVTSGSDITLETALAHLLFVAVAVWRVEVVVEVEGG